MNQSLFMAFLSSYIESCSNKVFLSLYVSFNVGSIIE